MRLSTRLLTYNWRLKLAALGLAVLIWAVVSAEQVTTQWIRVRVDPVVRDPEYVLSGASDPAEVRVQFSGPGRELWELAFDRPTIVLPLADVGERRAFPVDPSMLRPSTPRGVQVQDIRPAVVRVDLQRLASRVLPVRARIGRQSLDRYVLSDSVEILPAAVRVTGPADRLAELRAVTTERFEIVPTTDSTFSREIRLDTVGLAGVSFSRPAVRVSGAMDVRAQRALGELPVYAPEGLSAAPSRVQVTVQGPRRVLDRLLSAGLRAVVPRDSLPAVIPPGGVDAPLVFEGLPGAARAVPTPARVRVYPQDAAPAAADSQGGGQP